VSGVYVGNGTFAPTVIADTTMSAPTGGNYSGFLSVASPENFAIALKVDFMDGSQGIYDFLPGVPELASLGLLVLPMLMIRRRHNWRR
jgi:hypothetical protein